MGRSVELKAALKTAREAADRWDMEQAVVHLERALALGESELAADRPGHAALLRELGDIYGEDLFKNNEAEALLRRTLAIKEELEGPQGRALVYPLQFLARLYRRTYRLEEALRTYERAVTTFRTVFGEQAWGLDELLNDLGETYQQAGRYQDARERYQQALRVIEASEFPNRERRGEIRKRLRRLEAQAGI